MSTLSRIARHELVSAWRSRTLRVAALLVAVLLGAALLLEAVRHGQEARQRAALQEQVDREWREQPDRHPHRASHFGTFAFRKTGVLGLFDPGLEALAGTATFLEPHQRNFASFSEAAESSELARFGTPSAAFVLQVLLPLVIFCMTFGSIARERESGTWALAISQGVSAPTLLAGKVMGALFMVALLVVPVFGVALVSALLSGTVDASADVLARGALLASGYFVYLAICASVGVLVSFFHRRPQSALLTLLGLWAMFWVVTPRLATEAASAMHPAPSRAELEIEVGRAVRALGDSHDAENPHFKDFERRTLAQHGVSRVEELPVNYGGLVMAEAEKLSSKVHDDFHRRRLDAHRVQADLALAAGLYAPLLAMRSLSMGLAGTDGHHLADFETRAEEYRYGFVQRLNALHATKIRAHEDRAQRVDRAEWAAFPPFAYESPGALWALGRVASSGLALLGWAAALGIAVVLFGRYREAVS